MSGLKKFLKGTPVGRVLLIPYRYVYASRYFGPGYRKMLRWLFTSRELANFTYEISDKNRRYIALLLGDMAGVEPAKVEAYLRELDQDQQLASHIQRLTEASDERYAADPKGKPGKRYLYYALVRALKPRIIVEAGVEKGFGSCVMAAALQKNAEDGHPGQLFALDMQPNAGYLFKEPYASAGELVIGDSVGFLEELAEPIDLFFHDTTSDQEHERAQFAALEPKLSDKGVVCSAWHTEALMDLAERTGRRYLVYRDEPKDHWYPGATLGLAFPAKA